MTSGEVSAVLSGHMEWDQGANQRVVTWLAQDLEQLIPPGQDALPVFSLQELQDEQRRDAILSQVIPFVTRGRRPSRRERAVLSLKVLKTLKQWEKLKMLDDILYRVCKDSVTGKKRHQYMTPSSLVTHVLRGVHDDAGHQGQSRTLYLARQRFFWSTMEHDVRDYVKCCKRCVVSKTLEPEGRAPLESIKTTYPLELVCLDFWSAEDSRGRSVNVLVVTDHFTKMAHAFCCSDQSAKQVARQLWDRYFCVYGFPQRIHSDQGASFESQLIQELLQIAGVKKSRTTPYHPMGNGHTERFNRTLGNMIRALPPRDKIKWPQMLQTLTFAYNCTAHESTGYAPFYLMYGRVPRLPVDVMFHNVERNSDIIDYDSYVRRMRDDLKEALILAQVNTDSSQRRQADLYNMKTKGADIEEGDRVLLANRGERGHRKLADRWDSTLYTVVSKDSKCHTYHIKNTINGQEKIVHRNLILQASFLPVVIEQEVEPSFDSGSEPSWDQCDVERTASVTGSEVDPIERTASWVAETTPSGVPPERECASSEPHEVSPDNAVPEADNSQADSNGVSSHAGPCAVSHSVGVETNRANNSETDSMHGAEVPELNHSHPEDQVARGSMSEITLIHDRAPSNTVGHIRTRVGRIVKPVNRLIQNMTQRNKQASGG
uniref:Gypsy retrotransposon integrase-like protein 1 n=1 Tax=Erpetoichthys calabaricus TaxID=27687 RepID=A0A8C4SQC7_ERPCA